MFGFESALHKIFVKRPLILPVLLIFASINLFSVIYEPVIRSSDAFETSILILSVERRLSGKDSVTGRLQDGTRVRVDTAEKIFPGDRIRCVGHIRMPEASTVPGGFDLKDDLRKRGIYYIFVPDGDIDREESRFGLVVTAVRYALRDKIFEILSGAADPEGSGIMAALVLGDGSLADPDVVRDYRLTNCSHLLAVSGTHFSSFMLILPYLSSAFGLKKRGRRLLQLVFVILTGFMTGWTPSVTRSAFMSLAVVFGRDTLSSMSLAALVMIIADPFSCMSSGFKMSFGAVLGIMAFSGKITSRIRFGLPDALKKAASASVSAHLGILPFSFGTTMSLHPLMLVSQLIQGFLIRACCVLFIPGIMLSGTGPWALYPSIFLSELSSRTAHIFSDLYFDMPTLEEAGPLFVISLIFLSLFILFDGIIRRNGSKIPLYVFAVLLMLISVVQSLVPKSRYVFIDVGQGDSCLVIDGSKSMLVDGGTRESGLQALKTVLDHYRIRSPDMTVMTHWDEDHGGALLELLKEGRISCIRTSYTDTNDNVMRLLKDHGMDEDALSSMEMLKAGDAFRVGHTDVRVIWPEDVRDGENSDSIVLEADSFGRKVLLTGDIDTVCEDEIRDLEDIDILKVAHHGSRYSTGRSFLRRVTPEFAVISVGRYNSYGHPAGETIGRLGEVEAKIFTTSQNGTIIVTITDEDYQVRAYKEALRECLPEQVSTS